MNKYEKVAHFYKLIIRSNSMSEPRSNKSKLSTDFGINGSTKHILFIVPGQSISLILPDQHINASTRNINWDN